MDKLTFSLGRWFGIQVFCHWTLTLLLGVVILFSVLNPSASAVVLFVIVSALFFVLLHEFGHCLAARYFKIGTKRITLTPLGGMAQLKDLSDPWEEFWITAAGPMVNCVLAAIFAITNRFTIDSPLFGLTNYAFMMNFVLFVFNLLPAFPMDGGRLLRSFLTAFVSYKKSTEVSIVVSKFVCAGFIIYGLYSWNIMLSIIGVVMWQLGTNELKDVQQREIIKDKVYAMLEKGYKDDNLDKIVEILRMKR